MVLRSVASSCASLMLVALLSGPVVAGVNPPKANKAVDAAKKAADTEAKFEEAEVLRQAYNLITTADRDYDGHRAKAEGAVRAAIKELDHQVMKKGNNAQKAETVKEDSAAAAAKKAADQAPAKHEKQVNSDVQLAQALKILVKVRGVLVEKKQTTTLKHVDKAIIELETALKVK